jgi:hypothetical protein
VGLINLSSKEAITTEVGWNTEQKQDTSLTFPS